MRRSNGSGGLFAFVGGSIFLAFLVWAAAVSAVVYVVWHFVSKFW